MTDTPKPSKRSWWVEFFDIWGDRTYSGPLLMGIGYGVLITTLAQVGVAAWVRYRTEDAHYHDSPSVGWCTVHGVYIFVYVRRSSEPRTGKTLVATLVCHRCDRGVLRVCE
jgi:hypothetical protein